MAWVKKFSRLMKLLFQVHYPTSVQQVGSLNLGTWKNLLYLVFAVLGWHDMLIIRLTRLCLYLKVPITLFLTYTPLFANWSIVQRMSAYTLAPAKYLIKLLRGKWLTFFCNSQLICNHLRLNLFCVNSLRYNLTEKYMPYIFFKSR